MSISSPRRCVTNIQRNVATNYFFLSNTLKMNYFVSNEWGKNQYQNLNDAQSYQNAKARSIVSSLVVALCFSLLILSLWSMGQQQVANTIVGFDLRQTVLRKTSQRFLSYGLDSSLLRDMKNLPVNDKRFIDLARHLSPAYVRVGGTSADCLFFDQTLTPSPERIFDPVTGGDISNFTITDKDFISLGKFAEQSGARMIFDLNVLLRRSNGDWNYTDATKIISIARGHNLEMDWQLGNEPNSFRHVFNRTVSATQLALDYTILRRLLDIAGYESSNLIGPEVNHIGEKNRVGERYATEFLEYVGSSVTYVSWHQYYLNGRIATVEDFINPATFNHLPMQIKSIAEAINSVEKDVYLWLSETSAAYGGGAPKLSDRFVAGFLWLDKLGYCASAGINVVTRQSFFGGNYALVSPELTPNPDWWVSVAYKQFVSDRVLRLALPNNFGLVRLYAHCTPESALLSRVPAVTIYGVNLDKAPVKIDVQTFYPVPNKRNKVFVYALTSDALTSSSIQMNGETLLLQEDGELPPFVPIVLDPNGSFSLPAYSMNFIVLHGADVPACAA